MSKTSLRDSIQTQISSLVSEVDGFGLDDVLNTLNSLLAVAALIVAIVSFCVAVKSLRVAYFSLKYTKLSYEASKKTAENVMRITPDIQIAQFNDLIRHLYRDLVVTLAFSQKVLECLEKGEEQYPSEEHLLKLSVLAEEVCLENYNNDAFIYQKMHKLKILFRNYDAEIKTAMNHLETNTKAGTITRATKENTLSTLIYRALYLIEQILEISDEMKKQKETYWNFDIFKNAALIITHVHVDKLIKWKDSNASEFDWGNYRDLKEIVKLQETKEKLQSSYKGLIQAQKLFYRRATSDLVLLHNDEIFDSKEQYAAYKELINEICKQDEKLNTFNAKILSNDYDFKEHFLTMLSIDVTIELNRIHMIDIN